MNELKPIPIPFRQRWQEFRIVYLPLVTFTALIATICYLWANYVQPVAIVGEVESKRAPVITTFAGTVVSNLVDRLDIVTNGQPLAVVAPLTPAQLNAEIASAEADLMLMKARMDIDRTRNLESYSRLRIDRSLEQFRLQLARIRLTQAQAELDRARKLYDQQVLARGSSVDSDGLDVAVRDRDALQAEIDLREKTVAELDQAVQDMEATGNATVDPQDNIVERAIQAERARLEKLNQPVVLRAPLAGFISDVNREAGEQVTAGAQILVVSASTSDRILAWVRQPVTSRPQVGDIVEVRRIAMGEVALEAMVVKVGDQLEKINPSLLVPSRNPERVEVGLPMLVQSTEVRQLIPGEAVQLQLISQDR